MWTILLAGGPCTPPQVPSQDVIVQLFEWPYVDVGRECEAVLGPSGFKAVQVSPPQEHVVLTTAPWWERYQPVSPKLQGRLGDRNAFRTMSRRCVRAGVQVMVDVVLNHTVGASEGTGSAGTPFRRYAIPGIYDDDAFHSCRRPIQDWTSRDEIWTCELFGLPDLATEQPSVQHTLARHLDDLSRLGVDGLRIDSAKHIPPSDLEQILTQAKAPFEVVMEVIDHGNEAVGAKDYAHLGWVTDFRYGMALSNAFRRNDLASLRTFGSEWGLLPSQTSLVFVDNHDTQRQPADQRPLTYVDGPRHEMAVTFMLAWPHGRPRVMSSYAFDHRDTGPPLDAEGQVAPVLDAAGNCRGPFVCEHRTRSVRGMLAFRQTVGQAPVTDWWSQGPRRVAFSRGDRGFVVFNADDVPFKARIPTSLPPGTYCDVTGRLPAGAPCRWVEVHKDGHAEVWIDRMDVLTLHQAAKH
ncbi:MAG: alpha-amylase family protein [Myxococcota bacterium]